MGWGCGPAAQDDDEIIDDPPGCMGYVEFADAEQEAIVAALLGQPNGKVPGEVMASVDLFIGFEAGLTSLVGFECATNLDQIYLGSNEIVDITPIAGLPRLAIFVAQDNQIVDLGPLSAKASLFTLDVPGNPVSSTAAIVDMPMLANLDLDDTLISELDGLTGLPNLFSMRINGTQVSDLSALAGLVGLDNLHANDTALTSLASLPSLPGLTWAEFRGAELAELALVAELPQLEILDVADNHLTELADLAAATGVPALRSLTLDGNPLTDLDSLASLTSLRSLSISDVGLADLSPLATLTLISLAAAHDGVVDIAPVAEVDNLLVPDNDIVDISALAGTSQTQRLDLSNNSIADFTPLLSVDFGGCAEVTLVGNPATNMTQVADTLCASQVIVSGYCLPLECDPCPPGSEECG